MVFSRVLGGAVVVVVAVAAGLAGSQYRNQLVALDVTVDTQWKQVENQLVRQHELLPKLVSLTREYAEHEKEILERLIEARTRYAAAPVTEKPRVAAELDTAVTQFLALAEDYPELRADRLFRDLSYEIAGTKNRIAVERKRYNDAVGALNTRLRQVPWRFVAFDVEPREFYAAPEERLAEPDLAL